MPLYEYACTECSHRFEALVRGSQAPTCPRCQSTTLERRFSVFAAHTGGSAASAVGMDAPGPCGSCGDPRGPGACSMN